MQPASVLRAVSTATWGSRSALPLSVAFSKSARIVFRSARSASGGSTNVMGFQPVQNHANMLAQLDRVSNAHLGESATFHGYKVVVGRGEKSRPLGFNAN